MDECVLKEHNPLMASVQGKVLLSKGLKFGLDSFCFRQFDDPAYSGSRMAGVNKADFLAHARATINELKPGYAPWCYHAFLPNPWPTIHAGTHAITPDNQHLLRCGYVARTPKELPVLSRWFQREDLGERPAAKFLDLILYSADQVRTEHAAMGEPVPDPDVDWWIIAVKAQNEAQEQPMAPITAMRNALGVSEGGSGTPLDREAYLASVAFWSEHATVQ